MFVIAFLVFVGVDFVALVTFLANAPGERHQADRPTPTAPTSRAGRQGQFAETVFAALVVLVHVEIVGFDVVILIVNSTGNGHEAEAPSTPAARRRQEELG
jgi:hypothetical protein